MAIQFSGLCRSTPKLQQVTYSLTDEPDEVQIIKKSLNEHLDMDPRVTIGVLCDQIIPPDDLMDDEEQSIRDRLRSLVLAFLLGEAKRAIVSRHANRRGSDEEQALGNGLLMVSNGCNTLCPTRLNLQFKAIPKSTNEETKLIVKDLLLCLPSYRLVGSQKDNLLQTLLRKAKVCLGTELRSGEPVTINDTRFYLDLISFVITCGNTASATNLLRFYCDNLLGKIILQKLQETDQIFVVCGIAETLATCDANQESNSTPSVLASLQMQIMNALPVLLEASLPRFDFLAFLTFSL
jgi:hypothetical protein